MRKRFFFHYNKPESKRQGKVIWSVHWNKTCYLVHHIRCYTYTESKINKRQPYAVIRGMGTVLILVGKGRESIAVITKE